MRDRGAARRDAVRAGRWTASGTVKVLGPVAAGDARVAGLISVGGDVRAGTWRGRGTLEVAGALDVRTRFTADGTVRVAGPVHAGELTVRGQLLTPAGLRVDGACTITGLFESSQATVGLLQLVGAAAVPGALAARATIVGQFRADSHVGSIRAPTVRLTGPPPGLVPSLLRKVFGGDAHVTVDRIEGDRVELAAITVGFVRAASIVLGPDAHLAAYEGAIVARHRSAHVGPESRSVPPRGLSR